MVTINNMADYIATSEQTEAEEKDEEISAQRAMHSHPSEPCRSDLSWIH